MALSVCLTWDYELYFGESTGTVKACLLEPTKRLLELASKAKASMTFFVDVSYLGALERQKEEHPSLQTDYLLIIKQLKEIVLRGHDCQLHLHPHWEDSVYDGTKWNLDVRRYRIQDFSSTEIRSLVKSGSELLTRITGVRPTIFRAGGYCIQPFDALGQALAEEGILLDSSVFPGGKSPESTSQVYDFSQVKNQEGYYFSHDPAVVDAKGPFFEIPISSRFYSPLFFWKVYVLGRLNPKLHKGVGDGSALGAKGFRKLQLTQGGIFPFSPDGYYASVLESNCVKALRDGRNGVVAIGHPKALSNFSFKKLEQLFQNTLFRFEKISKK